MSAADPDPAQIVSDLAQKHGGAIVSAGLRGELSQDALDAAQDFLGAIGDEIGAGRQLERDRAELTRKKDLTPPDGFERLWAEVHVDAREKAAAAQADAERAYVRLKAALEAAALPTFEPGREQLARDECALALSSGNPEPAALDLAMRGNPEAVAALLSPWGRTLLSARGVRDPERVQADAKKTAVAGAMDRGDNAAALALRDHFSTLGVVKGTAGDGVRVLVHR